MKTPSNELVKQGIIRLQDINKVESAKDVFSLLEVQRMPLYIPGFVKKKHLWFWGSAGIGKSPKIFQFLDLNLDRRFQIPENNDWRGYRTQDILWMDEYHG